MKLLLKNINPTRLFRIHVEQINNHDMFLGWV